MFGDSIVFVLPTSGSKTLNKINDGSYSGEYLLKEATQEFKAYIRHTVTKTGVERHNVELTQRIYADGDTPEKLRRVYFVLECQPNDTDQEIADAIATHLGSSLNRDRLYGWES